jgi:hypothetical protein
VSRTDKPKNGLPLPERRQNGGWEFLLRSHNRVIHPENAGFMGNFWVTN